MANSPGRSFDCFMCLRLWCHQHALESFGETVESAHRVIGWLGDYDEILRHAPQHATTKPPGPLAFYVAMVRVAGPENAPMAIAVVIGLLSAAAVVATWVGVRIVAGEEA